MANQTIVKTWVSMAKHHASLLTVLLGSAFVGIWTLLRFFNSTTTYDLVTQQVLAHSWLHGYTEYIRLGPTNYLLKIFLLYIPTDLLPGSPRLKLIVLTILINIVTYLLLFVILRKILSDFKIITNTAYYGAMLWIAVIAGSLFWIGYANSRNLEVAGGMFLAWSTLHLLRQPTKSNIIGLTAFATLLFFADSLQIYMVALPLFVYAVLLAFFKKINWRRVAILLAVFSAGFMATLVLNSVAQHLLNYSVSTTGTRGIGLNISELDQASFSAVRSTLRQFGGGVDGGRLREIVNLLFLGSGLTAFIVGTVRRKIPLRFGVFIGVFLVTDELVYIASGAALLGDTSRYLIMLGPIVALAFGSLGYFYKQSSVPYIVISSMILINGFFLGQALAKNWDTSFPKDNHLASVARYLNSHSYIYAFGSMDVSTPLTYYDGLTHTSIFPIACANSKLVHADAYRNTRIDKSTIIMPIILDNKAIANTPNICSEQNIIDQLGSPASTDTTDDGSVVLVFDKVSLIIDLK